MNVEGAAFEPIHREVEVTPEMVEAAMTIFREEGIRDTSDDEMRAVMARAFPVMREALPKCPSTASPHQSDASECY